MTEDRTARGIAIAAVVVTLAVGGANLWETHRQVDVIQAQVDVAKETAQSAGPFFQATPRLAIYHPETNKWDIPDRNQNVTTEQAATGNLVLIITLVNAGNATGTVTEVSVKTGPDTYTPAPTIHCKNGAPKGSIDDACPLPRNWPPHAQDDLYIDLTRTALQQALTCNPGAGPQLGYLVNLVGINDPRIKGELPKTINWTTDCP